MCRSLPPVYSPLSLEVLSCILRIGRSGSNPERDLYNLLRRRYEPRDVLLTDSGTTALAIALRIAVARKPSLPVALPAWACYDLATATEAAGVGAALYDLDPETLGPDRASLARVLAAGVAAVVVVHPYGLPVDVPSIAALAAAEDALVVEDAAQAIGATLGTRPAGTAGAIGVLSFGRGKGWTGGGGGALIVNAAAPSDLTFGEAGSLPVAGSAMGAAMRLLAQFVLARPSWYALPRALPFLRLGQTVYRPPGPATGMTALEAAVLLASDPLQAPEVEQRRRHAAQLALAVHAAGVGRLPRGWEGGVPGWLRFPVLLDDGSLQRASTALARRLGIMPGYPTLLADLPGFRARLRGVETLYPGAAELAKRLYTLPTHSQVTERDLMRIYAWLNVGAEAGPATAATQVLRRTPSR